MGRSLLIICGASGLQQGVFRPLRGLRAAAVSEEGLHGSDFCFMPLLQLTNDDQWPRVLRVAGEYPGLTAAELAAPPSTVEAAAPGGWIFEFPDAYSSEFGMIAVPGYDLVHHSVDPVVVVAKSGSLGLPLVKEQEVLVVVDRDDKDFDDRAFFAFADAQGTIVMRRFESETSEYSIVGKIILIQLPFDPSTQPKSGTWLEEGDVSM